jgi:hypothetical protein
MWEFLNTDRWTMLGKASCSRREFVISLRRTPKYEAMLPQIIEMANAGSGIDLISRALASGPRSCGTPSNCTEQGTAVGRVDGRRSRQ